MLNDLRSNACSCDTSNTPASPSGTPRSTPPTLRPVNACRVRRGRCLRQTRAPPRLARAPGPDGPARKPSRSHRNELATCHLVPRSLTATPPRTEPVRETELCRAESVAPLCLLESDVADMSSTSWPLRRERQRRNEEGMQEPARRPSRESRVGSRESGVHVDDALDISLARVPETRRFADVTDTENRLDIALFLSPCWVLPLASGGEKGQPAATKPANRVFGRRDGHIPATQREV